MYYAGILYIVPNTHTHTFWFSSQCFLSHLSFTILFVVVHPLLFLSPHSVSLFSQTLCVYCLLPPSSSLRPPVSSNQIFVHPYSPLLSCSCWLSLEGGLLYAFVGPAAAVVLVLPLCSFPSLCCFASKAFMPNPILSLDQSRL